MATLLSAAEHNQLFLRTHLELDEIDALRRNFDHIVNSPGSQSVQDVFFARRGLYLLGLQPSCDCDVFKAFNKSHIQSGVDFYYRNTMISSCGCMESVILESIRDRFNEREETIPLAVDLFRDPEEEVWCIAAWKVPLLWHQELIIISLQDTLTGLCAWLLSEEAVLSPASYDVAFQKIHALISGIDANRIQFSAVDIMDILFALELRDKTWKQGYKHLSLLTDLISELLFPSKDSFKLNSNAYFYRLLISSSPDVEARTDIDASFMDSLFDHLRYSYETRIQVEAMESLVWFDETELAMHFLPREYHVTFSSSVFEYSVEIRNWRGERLTTIIAAEVVTLTSLSAEQHTNTLVSPIGVSISEAREVLISLPLLPRGRYALQLSCTVESRIGKQHHILSPLLNFAVSPIVELGSIRIGKSTTLNPNTADLLLLHGEKVFVGPGDLQFTIQNNSKLPKELLHIKVGLIMSKFNALSQVIVIVRLRSDHNLSEAALLVMKSSKFKGSKTSELIYDLSIDFSKLSDDFPRVFPKTGEYDLILKIVDEHLKGAKFRELGSIAIKCFNTPSISPPLESLYTKALFDASDKSFVQLPEIKHQFREEGTRAPAWMWVTAICLIFAHFVYYIVLLIHSAFWTRQIRFQIVDSIIFFVGISIISGILLLYWAEFDGFDISTAVKYVAGAGLVTAAFSYRLLASNIEEVHGVFLADEDNLHKNRALL